MLFQLYGSTAMTQLLGWVLVFAGLVILNEIGRRTKIGGIVIFVIIPAILTIYFYRNSGRSVWRSQQSDI